MTITIVLEIILILFGCMIFLTGCAMDSIWMMLSGGLFILTGIFEIYWIGATIPCVIAALVCLALSR